MFEGTYPHALKWKGCGSCFTIWGNEKTLLLFWAGQGNDFTDGRFRNRNDIAHDVIVVRIIGF